ncbi:MAG TPA: clan AA aspartic protease [Thermoanaerobaculia bacterium]|jgi:clan AA aspartic protease|nr:clan AA aspartic protease [Thermoanaerobaculia bacterium]
MMKGRVNVHREALIPLPLRGPQDEEHAIEAVIDTGYNGFLTLPPNLIALLGFPFLRSSRAILGDGSAIEFDIHEASLIWNGRLLRIPVDSADVSPLLGMALLYGHTLNIDVIEDGDVLIKALAIS